MTTAEPEVRLPRAVLAPLAVLGTVIGWVAGRAPLALGWTAGRAYLMAAFFAEAVVYGFRQGAMLGPKQPPPERKLVPPPDNSKV